MRHFRHRAFILLGLVVTVASFSTARAQEAEGAPSILARQELGIVRVDHHNTRLFVVPPDGVLASRESASTYLTQVATLIGSELPSWKEEWSVSFFSSAQVAGYKTEFMGVDEDREAWARGYLAEFDRQTRRLTYSPLDPKKVKHDVIELK